MVRPFARGIAVLLVILPASAGALPASAGASDGDGGNAAERRQDCRVLRVLPDGRLSVDLGGEEQILAIRGILAPVPLPDLYRDILMNRSLAKRKPLRCADVVVARGGARTATLSYFAWQDKSGDVWADVGGLLISEGAARVATGRFPEQRAYRKLQAEARARRIGIWRTM